jgi:hypothetical protein
MSENNFENNIPALVKRTESIIEKFLRQVLLKIRTDAISILDHNKVNVSGEIRKNIRTEILKEVGRIIGVTGVGENVPYAVYRHEGTKPHFPPLEAIQKWVVKRGLVKGSRGKALTSLKAMQSRKNADSLEAQVKSIAYLIARKISKKGTQGLPFLQMALNMNRSFIIDKFNTLQLS